MNTKYFPESHNNFFFMPNTKRKRYVIRKRAIQVTDVPFTTMFSMPIDVWSIISEYLDRYSAYNVCFLNKDTLQLAKSCSQLRKLVEMQMCLRIKISCLKGCIPVPYSTHCKVCDFWDDHKELEPHPRRLRVKHWNDFRTQKYFIKNSNPESQQTFPNIRTLIDKITEFFYKFKIPKMVSCGQNVVAEDCNSYKEFDLNEHELQSLYTSRKRYSFTCSETKFAKLYYYDFLGMTMVFMSNFFTDIHGINYLSGYYYVSMCNRVCQCEKPKCVLEHKTTLVIKVSEGEILPSEYTNEQNDIIKFIEKQNICVRVRVPLKSVNKLVTLP